MDYWDYLGWPDRFGHADYTKRQRLIAAHNRSRTIYTPQLVLHGQDFRSRHRFKQHVRRINSTPSQAEITLSVTPKTDVLSVTANASLSAEAAGRPAAVFLALYENNLSSQVTDGENAGRTLHHQFVVRRWVGPFTPGPQGHANVTQELPLGKAWQRQHMGVVVCVFDLRNGDVLQAVSLPLKSGENQR